MAIFTSLLQQEAWERSTIVQGSAVVLLLLALYRLIVYPFFLSPIRHVPGPWYARVSKLPLQYATFQRRRTEFATRLLDKYGQIVVIGPDQVHTTDDVAMKIIYDRSSLKTSFYRSMGSWKGITSTLGFIDYGAAAPTRNNLIQCFQNRNLATLVENIESHVNDFVKLLDRSVAEGKNVDGVVVFRLLALDIVTDVLWGEENRLLSDSSDVNTSIFLRRFHAFSTWNAMKSFIPAADLFVQVFGPKHWRQLRNDCNEMDVTARDALHRWEKNEDSRREKDVLSMLQSMNSSEDPMKRVPNDHIPAYMVEMLAAGSSTTSHTAAFACWMLTRDESAQKKLHDELYQAFPDSDTMDIKQAMTLPYLEGVIYETMRMFPMIPGPLERFLGKEIVVAGKTVPAGIVASTAAYNQGRLEEVFPEPQSWKPERWLEANERMNLNWTPFGYGCRACPGSNLAMTELKYMIGGIFRRFCAILPDGHENDTLELADVFAAGSKTGYCWLKFKRLDMKEE